MLIYNRWEDVAEFDLSGIVEPCASLKRIYSNGNRYYLAPNNTRYMSVTTMLSANTAQVIQEWRDRVGEEEADAVSLFSSTIGTKVHGLIENTLQNIPNEFNNVNMLAQHIYRGFVPNLKRISNIRAIELRMYSDSLKLAGTTDLICDFDGVLSLVDHKTSKYEKKEEWLENYYLQSTAYCIMFKERYGISINNIVLLVGSRNGDFNIHKSNPKKHLKRLLESNRNYNPLIN